MKTLKKIQLIEEPKSEELLRSELEEALGGWNCGTYDGGWLGSGCIQYDDGLCSNGNSATNYCGYFS